MLVENETLVEPEDITEEDCEVRPWNILESLEDEQEITDLLEVAIEEDPDDIPHLSTCLVYAAQARIINQLAQETGVDRQVLCDMFLSEERDDVPQNTDRNVAARLARAFGVSLPADSSELFFHP